MKRRRAIQNMVIITAGASMLPACDFTPLKVYANVPIEKDQRKMLSQLAELILPKGDLPIQTPETTLDFMLTQINDTFSSKDTDKFMVGLNEMSAHLKGTYNTALRRLAPSQIEEVLSFLVARGEEGGDVETSELSPLSFFYKTTNYLTQQHFTTSEYFLTSQMEYEFVPARYHGCVAI